MAGNYVTDQLCSNRDVFDTHFLLELPGKKIPKAKRYKMGNCPRSQEGSSDVIL
jgi:hypothetical protein